MQGLSNDVQDKMYTVCTNDLTDKREHDKEMSRQNTKWLHSNDQQLWLTLDCISPTLYRHVNTQVSSRSSIPVSNATPERSFSTMLRVKTYLQATMKTERLLVLALMHP